MFQILRWCSIALKTEFKRPRAIERLSSSVSGGAVLYEGDEILISEEPEAAAVLIPWTNRRAAALGEVASRIIDACHGGLDCRKC